MKKIVSMLEPFSMQQEIIVYENGNKIEVAIANTDDFVDTVFTLIKKYNSKEIEFIGPKSYAQGIGNKILEKELSDYDLQENTIQIKYI